MKTLLLSLVLLFTTQGFAQSESNQSVFSKNQKYDNEGVELYESNLDMKLHKKFGLGIALGGATGLLALNGEINLEPMNALTIGLGTGPSYGTFGLGWKHNFEGYYLSPYMKFGYSKWFSSSTGAGSATDSDVLKRIFSDNELKSGRFDADFIVGSAGIEYNQLEGDLAGVNFFGEVVLMTEFRKATVVPAGTVGLTYYY